MKQIRHIRAREVRAGDTVLTGLSTMPSHVFAWVVTETHKYDGRIFLSSDEDNDMAFEPLTILSVVRGRKARKAEKREGRVSVATVEALAPKPLSANCESGACKHRSNSCCCGCGEWLDECIC